MITDVQLDSVISNAYQEFILNSYDEFSKDYELYPSDELNYQLMFCEYTRQLSDREVADWIHAQVKDYDDRDEDDDVKKVRNQINFTTDLLLRREQNKFTNKLTKGACYA